ncbi:MAG: hypothetical protein R3C49_13980 [Planctomycetaceae bacterium]
MTIRRTLCLVTALLICGCADSLTGTLTFSDISSWKVPAEGSRIPAPRSLYAAEDDTVYALDDAGRVLVYDATGSLKQQWPMPESEHGRPEGVVRLLDGRIAVADTHYHRVVFFHSDGTVESMLGDKGVEPGQFVYPVAIAQDPNGFLYVGEYGDRQRVQKFTAAGEFVLEFGSHGTDPGQFQRPSGIIWLDGTVYVVDAFNNRIQCFDDSGHFLRVVEPPADVEPLEFPYDIRATQDGLLVVVENKGGRISVLTKEGDLMGRFGTPGRGRGEFFNPWSLTALSDGRILVADTGNHRIVELTP